MHLIEGLNLNQSDLNPLSVFVFIFFNYLLIGLIQSNLVSSLKTMQTSFYFIFLLVLADYNTSLMFSASQLLNTHHPYPTKPNSLMANWSISTVTSLLLLLPHFSVSYATKQWFSPRRRSASEVSSRHWRGSALKKHTLEKYKR